MCEHKFGFKKRDSGEFYCPVCRAIIDERLIKDLKRGDGWWISREKNK